MLKQAGKPCNWYKSFKESRQRKVQHNLTFLNKEETLAVLAPLTLLPKATTSCEHKEGWKEGWEKEESPCPPAYDADV
jgi:hypothetical protein